MLMLLDYVVVGLGGGVGALARYGAGSLCACFLGSFPWTTFFINVSGCFCMGVVSTAVAERWATAQRARLFLCTGFLGGFTTFSTYAVDVVSLVKGENYGFALTYGVATVIVSLLSTFLGVSVTRKWLRPTLAGGSS